ncbi:EamA family transporter [Desulfurococcaceae archaeon MEX13E-LK6-19]|nr:EamA family transporter [Desulfurococcaceae archaeon MEX13E-LK6-19]
MVYALACLISWGLWGLLLKLAYRQLSWVETYFISSLASFTIALSVFLYYGGKIGFSKEAGIFAVLAGILGGVGYILFMKALETGKASVVLPLTALYPAITVILAMVVLGEKISITQAIGIVLALIAVILISL